MLVDMHPDVTKLVWKFGRWHHQVDYSGFKQQLQLKEEFKNQEKYIVDNHGIKMIRIPRELCNTEYDNAEYLKEHYYSAEFEVEADIFLK